MERALYIQILETTGLTARWFDSGSASTSIHGGTLDQAVEQAAPGRTVLVIPGTAVLTTRLTVPTTSRKRLLQAVPYALEEHLTEDVDSLHFALGQPRADQSVSVAIIQKKLLAAWLQPFRNRGIEPIAVIPDYFLLPWSEGEWTLQIDGPQALVRQDDCIGFATELSNLGVMYDMLVDQSETPPQRIRIFTTEQNFSLATEVETHYEPPTAPLIGQPDVSSHWRGTINLMQGEFSRREQLGRNLRPWRYAAALFGTALLLQAGMGVWSSAQLKERERSIRTAIEQQYRDAFPEARNIVDPRLQMERKLEALRQTGSGDSDLFLKLLSSATAILAAAKSVTVESISFRNGELDLEVTASDIQLLDGVKQQLVNQTPFNVELLSASSRNDKVEGRLRIKAGTT